MEDAVPQTEESLLGNSHRYLKQPLRKHPRESLKSREDIFNPFKAGSYPTTYLPEKVLRPLPAQQVGRLQRKAEVVDSDKPNTPPVQIWLISFGRPEKARLPSSPSL